MLCFDIAVPLSGYGELISQVAFLRAYPVRRPEAGSSDNVLVFYPFNYISIHVLCASPYVFMEQWALGSALCSEHRDG
jgi:hypothetical protein